MFLGGGLIPTYLLIDKLNLLNTSMGNFTYQEQLMYGI